MNIVFMGTPDFAVKSLDELVKNKYNVVGVVTAPDKPSGRGQKVNCSAVKLYAESMNLNILQPTNLKDESFVLELQNLKPDLIVVVAFRMLPKVVWNSAQYGTINLHASLLPQYRGAAPINWAIINGETETGVTTFFIDENIDCGNILMQEKVKIENSDNAGALHDKLMDIGSKLLVKTVNAIKDSCFDCVNQNDICNEIADKINLAPKIFKEDCKIDWNNSSEKIYNFIRGLSPYPAAFTEILLENNELLFVKIYENEIADLNIKANSGKVYIENNKSLYISAKDKWLKIIELQPASKKKMLTSEFLKGCKIKSNI